MLEQLIHSPRDLARHRAAPYLNEREQYLNDCAAQQYSRSTLLLKARELLWVARKLSIYPNLQLTYEQIEAVACGWDERQQVPKCTRTLDPRFTRGRFLQAARTWLRFLGCLVQPEESFPFAEELAAYIAWMRDEQEMAATTVDRRTHIVRRLLRWYADKGRPLVEIGIADVDVYLAQAKCTRRTLKNVVQILRSFFHFCSTRGWCAKSMVEVIVGPKVFPQELIPTGPPWSEVQRLLASMDSDSPADRRDLPVLMLCAIYGFRACEVAHLQIDDIDWDQGVLRVTRAKRKGRQLFPLVATVGNALADYLRLARPPCGSRRLFLTLHPPFRPLTSRGVSSLATRRLSGLGIQARSTGAHCLRHACATHMLARGLSLKEIGDQLGHRSTLSTRTYAKVDLAGLRRVAAFDLGELS